MKRSIFCLALFLCAVPAQAANIVSGLSQDQIQITSNYTGTDIVVFGAIERANDNEQDYDVVVVVRGPDANMVVRKKDRVAGLWINRDQAQITLPVYYFLAGTRPLTEIAQSTILSRYGIGLENLRPSEVISHHDPEPFQQALIRQQEAVGLYGESYDAVEFLSGALFRVRVPVPAGVARGQYNAEVYLFRNGTVEAAQSTPLFVDQIGIERRIFNLAHEWPFYYGLSAVLMAVFLGWLSSVTFRRPI